jgi:hypothetical protein
MRWLDTSLIVLAILVIAAFVYIIGWLIHNVVEFFRSE